MKKGLKEKRKEKGKENGEEKEEEKVFHYQVVLFFVVFWCYW